MKVIEVNNLNFSYDGKINVLNGVSFSLEKGKYYSIIGRNGSGKSTLAKLLLGLLDSKEGEIKVLDTLLNHKTVNDIRSHMGIVFQNPDNQFIGSTVRDDIAFGLENRKVPSEMMDDIIEKYARKVNMLEFLDKEPENLSGGQKQRVAIAGAIAMNPEILILDEATAMLDPKGKREIKETLNILRQERPELTIISITHDIEEAFESDEILLVDKGEIAYQGDPKELEKDPSNFEKYGITMPFRIEFAEELKKCGFDIVSNDSLEGIVKKICQ